MLTLIKLTSASSARCAVTAEVPLKVRKQNRKRTYIMDGWHAWIAAHFVSYAVAFQNEHAVVVQHATMLLHIARHRCGKVNVHRACTAMSVPIYRPDSPVPFFVSPFLLDRVDPLPEDMLHHGYSSSTTVIPLLYYCCAWLNTLMSLERKLEGDD